MLLGNDSIEIEEQELMFLAHGLATSFLGFFEAFDVILLKERRQTLAAFSPKGNAL